MVQAQHPCYSIPFLLKPIWMPLPAPGVIIQRKGVLYTIKVYKLNRFPGDKDVGVTRKTSTTQTPRQQ